MSGITPSDQVKLLTKLPAPSDPPPQLATGTVALFRDDNWSSQRLDLAIDDYVSNKRQTLQSHMFDQTTYVAFNLPVGTVMTLMDNMRSVPAGHVVADISGCGRCVDLVGTGETEAVDLKTIDMNDRVSAFFWRTVDLNLGAIELFEHTSFKGARSVIFLSEWNSGSIIPLQDWWLQDTLSSVRWKSLQDRQMATLFEHTDGTGDQFNNIKSWGSSKEVSDLGTYSFNDKASALRWEGVNPVKEVIAPFSVIATNAAGTSGLTSVITGTNNSSEAQPVTLKLDNSTAQTVTVTTTDTHVVSTSLTVSLSETVGLKDIASVTAAWSVALKYDYTHSDTKSKSETKTIALSISQTVNAPPHSSYKATLLVNIGQIPATVYHTTAERWYKVPVTGGQADSSNQNWYKRVEPVSVTMCGSLASSTNVDIQANPLKE